MLLRLASGASLKAEIGRDTTTLGDGRSSRGMETVTMDTSAFEMDTIEAEGMSHTSFS